MLVLGSVAGILTLRESITLHYLRSHLANKWLKQNEMSSSHHVSATQAMHSEVNVMMMTINTWASLIFAVCMLCCC